MPLSSGDTFAGYTIERLLGAGAMGEVYLARHPRLARSDALKILPTAFTGDYEYRERFNREADVAAGLYNPHVVGVHDRGEFDGHLWISMDFVDGTDAARLLRDYPRGLPADDVFDIVDAVADALDFAHQGRLLHRDVKPANILLTPVSSGRRRILLADFGIARKLDDVGLTATNMALGTVNYAAPEQLMGQPLDGRTDQYALAATAFHLLTGNPLFPSSNSAVTISKHLSAEPPRLAATRPELAPLDATMAQALLKQPAGRFDSCQSFATALRNSMNQDSGQQTTARPALLQQPPPPPPQRPPVPPPPRDQTVARPVVPPEEHLSPQALAWSSEPATDTYEPQELYSPQEPYAPPVAYPPQDPFASQDPLAPQEPPRTYPPGPPPVGPGQPRRGSWYSRPAVIATAGVMTFVLAVSIAFIAWPREDKGTAAGSSSSLTTQSPTDTTSTSNAPTSTSAAPNRPAPPRTSGANPTIADYIQRNGLVETSVRRGDPGSPTLTLPMPDGWKDAGAQLPEWAYSAIVYPAVPSDPPTVTAVMSKLTGDVDEASIFDYAGGELKNLPGYEGSAGGISAKQLSGYDAYQIGGTYVKDGVKRLIAQKTIVVPSNDGVGIYVIQLNANGTSDQVTPMMNVTSAIDDQTTITP